MPVRRVILPEKKLKMRQLILFPALLLSLALLSGCLPDTVTPEEQLVKDIKKIEEYLTAKGLTAQSTASGLHIVTEVEGTGGSPSLTDSVEVFYKGYYTDDSVFDESLDKTIKFPLNRLILGWQEGLQFFKKGGKGKLLIPSGLGYGPNPGSGIRSNAVLIFDLELVDFNG